MRKFFFAVCFLATIFDGFMTMMGLCVAAKVHTLPGYMFSVVGAFIILALMVSFRDIFTRRDALHRSMRIYWGAALLVNITTVLLAGFNHVVLEKPFSDSVSVEWSKFHDAGLLPKLTMVVLTFFLVGAPIVLSNIWGTFFHGEYDDEDGNADKKASPPPIPRPAGAKN